LLSGSNYISYLSFSKNLQYQIYSNMNQKRILVKEPNLRLSHMTELVHHDECVIASSSQISKYLQKNKGCETMAITGDNQCSPLTMKRFQNYSLLQNLNFNLKNECNRYIIHVTMNVLVWYQLYVFTVLSK
jgi:hypothetical protein